MTSDTLAPLAACKLGGVVLALCCALPLLPEAPAWAALTRKTDVGLADACNPKPADTDIVLPMQAKGQGSKGTQALIECLAELSAKKWRTCGCK